MPLVKCSECGRPVSDAAATCPGCGHPVHDSVPMRRLADEGFTDAEADRVIRRAVELHKQAASRRPTTLSRESLEEGAEAVGVPREFIQRAIGEIRERPKRPGMRIPLVAGAAAIVAGLIFWLRLADLPHPAGNAQRQPAGPTNRQAEGGWEAQVARDAKAARAVPMVEVPAGEFAMGRNDWCDTDERPEHRLRLRAFRIDKHEVATAHYAAFLNTTRRDRDQDGNRYLVEGRACSVARAGDRWEVRTGAADLPMVGVTWYGAAAYAGWVGKRLPTEAEWEKAARGTDKRSFPWGRDWDPQRCNTSPRGCGNGGLFATNSLVTGASPYGLLHMAGNAMEWTSSAYRPYPYRSNDGRENPKGGEPRVARGGGPLANMARYVGTTDRNHGDPTVAPWPGIGFRCAK